MQYEIIANVRLVIIAEILGLIAAELLPGRVAAFKCVWELRQDQPAKSRSRSAQSRYVPVWQQI